MKARFLSILAVLALVLLLVPAASAQTMCFNLSEYDCAILENAQANSNDLTSFKMFFTFDLSTSGLAALGASDVSVSAEGGGPIMVDPALMTGDNPYAGLAMALDLKGSVSDGTMSESGSISFVIADGNVYFNDGSGWMGTSLAAAAGSAGMPLDPGMMMDMMDSSMDPAMMGMLEGLMNIPGFITAARLPNTDMMGQTMYPFAFTIDFIPFLNSAEFGALLAAQMGGDSAQMAQLIPMIIGQSTATLILTEWIGANDNFVHKLRIELNANIDTAGLMMMMGGGGGTPASPILATMVLEVDLSDLNVPVSITAPEGAQMMGG